MLSPLEFRNISVGDLLMQKIPDPANIEQTINRRGIIINVSNNISTIEWAVDNQPENISFTKTTILNVSLRRMIIDGYLQHYPIRK
jgi:hypothetical protein